MGTKNTERLEHSTVGKTLVLHIANPGMIPGIPYVPLRAYQESFLSEESGETP